MPTKQLNYQVYHPICSFIANSQQREFHRGTSLACLSLTLSPSLSSDYTATVRETHANPAQVMLFNDGPSITDRWKVITLQFD